MWPLASKGHPVKGLTVYQLFTLGLVLRGFQGALEDGTPFGPSTSIFKILPKTSIVATGENITLIPYGGTAPISWTSADTTIGTIVVNTGVFTAGANQGTTTVNALDAVGNLVFGGSLNSVLQMRVEN